MRRPLLSAALVSALAAGLLPRTASVAAARPSPLVGAEVTIGAVTTWIASDGPPVRGAYQGATESVSGAVGNALAQSVQRGPGAQLPAPPRERLPGLVERLTRVCDVPARRREHVERFQELTSWVQDPGDGYVEEVRRLPGRARITLAFVYDGVPYRLEHSLTNRTDRARFRAHERRFFGSVRCARGGEVAPTPSATPSPTPSVSPTAR